MALPPINKPELESLLATALPLEPMVLLEVSAITDDHQDNIDRFLMVMQDTGFLVGFDWMTEFENSQERLNDIEVVRTADLELLRMIMIAHTRIDRMNHGHLHALITSGYWAVAVARVQELINEM